MPKKLIDCPIDKTPMKPGIILVPTIASGAPDFGNDVIGITMHEGPGVIINCLKCPKCGHSLIFEPRDHK